MPPSHDESSSDLRRAREISRRLAHQERRGPGEPEPPPPPPQPRFSADRARGLGGAAPPREAGAPAAIPRAPAPPAAPALAAARPARRTPPLPSGGGFEALLGWCREVLPADSAFLIDERGLLVASSGGLPAEEAEGMGSRLVLVLEQADRMASGQRARSVAFELSGGWLTGWRVAVEGGAALAVGFLGPKPPGPDAGALVARAFAGKAGSA